jgi:hypothetical protein
MNFFYIRLAPLVTARLKKSLFLASTPSSSDVILDVSLMSLNHLFPGWPLPHIPETLPSINIYFEYTLMI